MEIIPAIDVMDGKCVRLKRGRFGGKKIYSEDPLKIALAFQKAGLKKLHLIDLEGAKEGKIKNWETIKKIAQKTNLLIEFGGGVRDEKDIKKLLNLGIERVILGSIVLRKPLKFENILKKFGSKRIIVAADVKENKIYYGGWQKEAKRELNFFLEDLAKLGIKTVICTDIDRDGMLKGPNYALYKRVLEQFPQLKVVASGGIRGKKDLKKLADFGLAGAIVGKAFYEKKIPLKELAPLL